MACASGLLTIVADISSGGGGPSGRRNGQQLAAECKFAGTMAVGEEAVVPDAMEAIRQGVQQEAADELIGIEGHDLRFAVMPIILPAEGDAALCQADETRVG